MIKIYWWECRWKQGTSYWIMGDRIMWPGILHQSKLPLTISRNSTIPRNYDELFKVIGNNEEFQAMECNYQLSNSSLGLKWLENSFGFENQMRLICKNLLDFFFKFLLNKFNNQSLRMVQRYQVHQVKCWFDVKLEHHYHSCLCFF